MTLTNLQINHIEATIRKCLREKFLNYTPESSNMPFHYRLLGKDRMALYSFIQSLNTTFGTSIFEPVAVELAKTRFIHAESKYVVGTAICENAQNEIQRIINNLTTGSVNPNKTSEIEKIRSVCKNGNINSLKPVKADLFVEDENKLYLFDLKTAKPNISNFKDFKRTLLEWTAIMLFKNPNAKVNTILAIPYNPYEPKPYERWTLKGMLDLKNELMVADEFWDFLGGRGAYEELLGCFEKVGIELREEIDEYFKKFLNKQN